MVNNNKSQDTDNLKDPNIKLYSPYFWFKYFIRKLAYQIPPSRIKNFFLRLSGIVIEKDVFVGDRVLLIDGYRVKTLVLKKKSVISPGCILMSAAWPYKSDIVLYNTKVTKAGSLVIHENAWVGAGSILLADSSLGKRSILGAGSVLTKKTNENEIWYGSPAIFQKKLY